MGNVVDLRIKAPEKLIDASRDDWSILIDEQVRIKLKGKEYIIKTLTTREWARFLMVDFPEFVAKHQMVYNYIYLHQAKLENSDTELSKNLMEITKRMVAVKVYMQFLRDLARLCKKYFDIPRRVVIHETTINEILLLLTAMKLTQDDCVKKNFLILAENTRSYLH